MKKRIIIDIEIDKRVELNSIIGKIKSKVFDLQIDGFQVKDFQIQ